MGKDLTLAHKPNLIELQSFAKHMESAQVTMSDQVHLGLFRSLLNNEWTGAHKPSTIQLGKFTPTTLSQKVQTYGYWLYVSFLPQTTSEGLLA